MAYSGRSCRSCHALASRCSSRTRTRSSSQRPRSKDVGEESVVAVPAALVVEWHEEEVLPLEGFEDLRAVRSLGERVAEGGVHPLEEGGLQQEVAKPLGQSLQHLLAEVVDDEAVAAGEGFDEPGEIRVPAHRECGELESGDPPLGARLQRRNITGGQVEAHHLLQKGCRLAGGEAQVRRPQLREVAVAAQPTEREERVGTGGDHDVQVCGSVFEEIAHGLSDGRRIDRLEVIQQQHRRNGRLLERIDHPSDDRLECSSSRWELQGHTEIAEEPLGVVVVLIERDPCDVDAGLDASNLGDPFAQEGRLAEAGGGGDESQSSTGGAAVREPYEQAGACDGVRTLWRHEQLGRDDQGCHGPIITLIARPGDAAGPRGTSPTRSGSAHPSPVADRPTAVRHSTTQCEGLCRPLTRASEAIPASVHAG